MSMEPKKAVVMAVIERGIIKELTLFFSEFDKLFSLRDNLFPNLFFRKMNKNKTKKRYEVIKPRIK